MQTLSEDISRVGDAEKSVTVDISMSVMSLLSEQLYSSPLKAIEELVVNSWDADAKNCMVSTPNELTGKIVVFDDGFGMSLEEMVDLWHIGRSRKGATKLSRKKIGKFGIGKLASYAVASRATYISKKSDSDEIHAVTIDFDRIQGGMGDETQNHTLEIRKAGLEDLEELDSFNLVMDEIKPDQSSHIKSNKSWTIVVLEALKERAEALLSSGRLTWVLSTAMPRSSDFRLYLNGEYIAPSKSEYTKKTEFKVGDLPADRLKNLAITGTHWKPEGNALVCEEFPSGITGEVFVTERSLFSAEGKSEDLGRSHGFFVRVLGRLLNESDPYFGTKPQSFSTWYRFAAEIEVPDLNDHITAARDSAEQSSMMPKLRALLLELFKEARERADRWDQEQEKKVTQDVESRRQYVSRGVVERPLADAIIRSRTADGTNHSSPWSLLSPVADDGEVITLLDELYASDGNRRSYVVTAQTPGEEKPFAQLNPLSREVALNEEHPLSVEYGTEENSRRLLALFGISEALLEVYLAQAGLAWSVINEVLRQRDLLLRSLAVEQMSNPAALARELVQSSQDGRDSKRFEIAVVAAMRLMGFSAIQKSNAGNSDGLAQFTLLGGEDLSIALETKAGAAPDLSRSDLAGVASHRTQDKAKAALFVAPELPGDNSDPDSELARRAKEQKVSCWTVSQLASVVEVAESRRINARDFFKLVNTKFAPVDVAEGVREILTPVYSHVDIYREVIASLRRGERRPSNGPRQIGFYFAKVQDEDMEIQLTQDDFTEALKELSVVSRGMISVDQAEERVEILGSLDEVERRVASFTQLPTTPRRSGNFFTLFDGSDSGATD
ncbi:ATP-binding protein [Micrococcus luteus]|nr:ATP-binding protein [Micrococcus luteus]